MIISTKCQYALRAVYEIVRSNHGQVLTIGTIARAQRIPQRYLEGILNQLRKGGLLEAQRGRSGGYKLARDAGGITVGEVVRLIDGPIRPMIPMEKAEAGNGPVREDFVFLPTWEKVQDAIDRALNSTTFSQLLEREREAQVRSASSYVI